MPDKLTELIHHPYHPPAGFDAVPPGVFKASTVIFKDVAALRARSWKSRAAYTYGLHGTPTSFTLEERLATLEGGTHCVLAPSGLSAINLANLALLKQGDEMLLPHNVYGPSKEVGRTWMANLGVSWREYDASDPASLRASCGPRTRLIWLEAPGSVTMEFPDLRGLVRAARESSDAVLALDNTWGAGLAFNAFDMGVDIAMHALTKYPSGGADVLMGSLVTRDQALAHQLLQMHAVTGLGVGANDVELVLRSLPTMRVRYEAHDRAARELASWLGTQPQVSRVLHPALPGAPGHEHWASHCSAAAGLFSILLDERFASHQVDRFVDSLTLFKIGYSWGGPVSLVVPYEIQSMRTAGKGTAWRGHLGRFSIGLEAVDDLRSDLLRALNQAFGA